MDYAKLKKYRHADPLKVRQVWDALGTAKNQRPAVPIDKLTKTLHKSLGLKDDQIRLLFDEIEGDKLIDKIEPSLGKCGLTRYQLPDFSRPCPRGKHDWYCFQCHKPGEVLCCSDCFRVYHADCAHEAGVHSPSRKSMRSPTLHDSQEADFTCPVCESRPKCEFSRKQIRKLLEFATHHLRKQPLWKNFLQIGYRGDIMKNEYLVYKYTDLELLHRKITDGRYAALEEFSMDVQLLVHDVCILHGPYSNEADEIRFLLRSVNTELSEIQLCTDCYINAKARVTDWISKPCKPHHELIWARNRTSAGAGLFSDTSVSQFYWPAKVLLERDDGYEIRFFGGTHERMYVKKIHTRPFHLPADEVGVLRRSNTSGAMTGGGFEKSWNEVSKLQANIDSGYYTHSSGESDLPPSDDDYSDELYLGPRRRIPVPSQRTHRLDSPRSSLASGTTKGTKRRRCTSSSSHHTTNSHTPNADMVEDSSPSRVAHANVRHFNAHNDRSMSDKRQALPRIQMPSVQPGTPGAAAISALAETKAAMAAAVGSGRKPSSFTADLLSLTERKSDLTSRHKRNSVSLKRSRGGFPIVRGQRGRGRLSYKHIKSQSVRRRKYASSSPSDSQSSNELSSSLSSDSLSAKDDKTFNVENPVQNNWRSIKSSPDLKPVTTRVEKPRRGRPPKFRGLAKLTNDTGRNWVCPTAGSSGAEDADDWTKSIEPNKLKPGRGRPRTSTAPHNSATDRLESLGKKRSPTINKSSTFISGKKSRRGSKQFGEFENLLLRHDEDDESTDRCVSPILNETHESKRYSSTHRNYLHQPNINSPILIHNSVATQHSPLRKLGNNEVGMSSSLTSTKRPTLAAKNRSPASSNCSSCSSASSDIDDDDDDDDRGAVRRHRIATIKIGNEDRKFRSPTRSHSGSKDQKSLSNNSAMLRRPPFAPPLGGPNISGGHMFPPDRSNYFANAEQYPNASQNPLTNCSQIIGNSNSMATSGSLANLRPDASNHQVPTSNILSVSSGLNISGSNSIVTAPGMSTLPRSHLPPNKRAAAEATAALNRDSLSSANDTNEICQRHQSSLRSPDGPVTISPKKQLNKGIQTPANMEMPLSQTCPQCKDREAERIAAANDATKALRDLEERLLSQFKEEKAAAVQAALEKAQTTLREAIEHEQKLARDALEAAEARFTEVIVQTKRRQWCRNCLAEAIYHCCWNTSYCSTQCQQEHWQKEHKRQCRRKR